MERVMDIHKELEVFTGLEFNAFEHKYTYQGKEFISATTIKKKFKPEFKKDVISRAIARRDNTTQEFVLRQWAKAGKIGTTKGDYIHRFMECLMTGEEFYENLPEFIDELKGLEAIEFYKKLITTKEKAIKWLNDNPHLLPIQSEVQVFDTDYMLAGTFDQLMYNQNTGRVELWDWKTDKEFTTKAKRKGERFLKPLNHLEVCKLNEYSLQVNIYKYIINKYTNLNILPEDLKVLWINENNCQEIQLLDLEEEVKVMLEHRHENIKSNISS